MSIGTFEYPEKGLQELFVLLVKWGIIDDDAGPFYRLLVGPMEDS